MFSKPQLYQGFAPFAHTNESWKLEEQRRLSESPIIGFQISKILKVSDEFDWLVVVKVTFGAWILGPSINICQDKSCER